ncbi:MAG: DNA-deoxyinosine glycosylase [Amaricoccus sp.]|uniref:DNA-deoxyinosine glycosylase n=1 Tax=Amaricoccus sp. TaxID=1872485 RepID=UPI0039E28239
MTGRHRQFPPVVDGRTRVLILGSLPGSASLAAGEYYAHPRNAFWHLLAGIVGTDLPALPYAERLAALRRARIGLWDTIATARRQGSLDAAIRDPEAADLFALLERLPDLRAIGFNGATAARHGRRSLAGAGRLPELIDLPSSSPAHARMTLAEKRARWETLARHLGD